MSNLSTRILLTSIIVVATCTLAFSQTTPQPQRNYPAPVEGDYTINVHVRDEHIQRYHDYRKRAAVLIVEGRSIASREISGHVNYPHDWEIL